MAFEPKSIVSLVTIEATLMEVEKENGRQIQRIIAALEPIDGIDPDGASRNTTVSEREQTVPFSTLGRIHERLTSMMLRANTLAMIANRLELIAGIPSSETGAKNLDQQAMNSAYRG